MGIANLAIGQQLSIDGENYLFTRIFDADRYELEHRKTLKRLEYSQGEILDMYTKGRLTFSSPGSMGRDTRARQKVYNSVALSACTKQQHDLAVLRLHFVKNLEGLPLTRSRIEPLIEAIWEKLKPSDRIFMSTQPHASTVSRWIQRWRDSSGCIGALIDHHSMKGNRNPRRDDAVAQIVDDAIQHIYLKPERASLSAVRAHVNDTITLSNQGLIASERLEPVGDSYIRSRLKLVPAYDRWTARYGKRSADVKFRVSGKGASADLPLSRASMDHHRLDLFVVDEQTRLPLGRPWLTIVLDECTRMILGYSLSFDEPSAMSVMRALRHALLPKELRPTTVGHWPAWGIIDVLVVDNGLEFHGQALDYVAGQFGISIQTCPRRQPWYKGKVERFFRTAHGDLISGIPGRTFSNIIERDEYNSAKNAVISLSTLVQVVEKWMVDIYHQTSHSAINESPNQKWDRLIHQVDRYLPSSSQWTDAAFGKPDTRMLGHQGVEFDCLFYNSDDLGALRRLHGDRFSVEIIVNDEDVGYMYVLDPKSGEPIKIPAVDLAYASGLTRWQHRKCKEYRQYLSESSEDPVSLAYARKAISELIAQDMLINPKRARARSGRYLGQPSWRPASASPSTTPVAPPKGRKRASPDGPVPPPIVTEAKQPTSRPSPDVGEEHIPTLSTRTAYQYVDTQS